MSVLFEKRGAIASIRLNRPERLNAIDQAMADALAAALHQAESDPEVRISILSGVGRSFCAGMDLEAFTRGERPGIQRPDAFAGFVAAPRKKPIIAAVQGAVLAGGFEIMLACDLVVAAEGTVFGLPEVSLGLLAAGGGTFRLPRRLPHTLAIELILTGDRLDGQRALALGLINSLVPLDCLESQASSLAERIVANAPRAVESAFALIRATLGMEEDRLWRLSDRLWSHVDGSADALEGARAFKERRRPIWSANRA